MCHTHITVGQCQVSMMVMHRSWGSHERIDIWSAYKFRLNKRRCMKTLFGSSLHWSTPFLSSLTCETKCVENIFQVCFSKIFDGEESGLNAWWLTVRPTPPCLTKTRDATRSCGVTNWQSWWLQCYQWTSLEPWLLTFDLRSSREQGLKQKKILSLNFFLCVGGGGVGGRQRGREGGGGIL